VRSEKREERMGKGEGGMYEEIGGRGKGGGRREKR
jgi:hypothetical protein